MPITIRTATLADVVALEALNKAAYPDLVEDGAVFARESLANHQRVFPRGQLVAEDDGAIVGAIATFILPEAIDPFAKHTWMGVTDAGTLARHDPHGSTLYLVDIYVAESAWGRGVGRELYRALFALCREVGCARVVGGGRLHDFIDAPDDLSVQDYVMQCARGERVDRVLRSQLRAGFTVRGVMKDYLHDWRSRHWATLIVWEAARSGTVGVTAPADVANPAGV